MLRLYSILKTASTFAAKKYSYYDAFTDLWVDFLSNSAKGDCGINIFAISNMRDICKDYGFAIDEPVQDVFLQCLVIVLDSVGLPNFEGVAAMRQHHRNYLLFIVKQVAAMNVSDRDLVFDPITKKITQV